MALLVTKGIITPEIRNISAQIEKQGSLKTDIYWINSEKPEAGPILHKYAIDEARMPFILLFDLGIPVFGEQVSTYTPARVQKGKDVIPEIVEGQRLV